MSKTKTKTHLAIQALCEGAILVALAQILGYLKLLGSLNAGGSITLAMFPVCLYAVRWGLKKGLLAALALSLLQLFLDGAYAWGWQCMILDYLLAYTALGLAGLFHGKSWSIFPGILVGGLAKFLFHFISGVTLYRIVEPTEFWGVTFSDPALFSLIYNGSYVIPCIVLSLVAAGLLYLPMKKYLAGEDLR